MAETDPTTEDTTPAPDASGTSHQSIWNVPNQLTIARLVLSVVFFVILALETHWCRTRGPSALFLNVSMALFIFAVLTDFLDGYLARKWGMTSTFGRIADPFADKIVICGGFVMLTGVAGQLVEPWFAVVIMFREFLVSGLRSFLESRGVAFGAAWSGKMKMVAQSVAIPAVIFYQANFAGRLDPLTAEPSTMTALFYWIAVVCLVVTLVATVGSCFGYVSRAVSHLRNT